MLWEVGGCGGHVAIINKQVEDGMLMKKLRIEMPLELLACPYALKRFKHEVEGGWGNETFV